MTTESATVTPGVDTDFYRPRGPKTLDYKGTRANQPTLVKFGAEWCGACVAYTESGGWRDTIALAKRLDVELRDCDADRHQQALALVAEYSGSDDVGIPLLILFHATDRAAPAVYDGAMAISAIREWLERHLGGRRASIAATATAVVAAPPLIAASTPSPSSSSLSADAATSSRRRLLDAPGAKKTSTRKGDDDNDDDVSDGADQNGGADEPGEEVGGSTSAGVTQLVGQREVRDYLRAHRDGVVVLQWSAPGCEWCAELADEMSAWSARYGTSGFAFAETDAKAYGLSRLKWSRFPVTQVLRGGVERAVVRGYQPETIEDEIDRIARDDAPIARR